MVAPIYYYSTNRQFSNQSSGDFERISFQEALFQGQAQDEGLFMPDRIPKVSPEELRQLPHMRYPEIASLVLGKFLRPEISASVLSRLAREAYTFEIAIESLGEKRYLMRLDQGPTASFKDFAAQMLARLMGYFNRNGNYLNLLVATSGDTGSAIGRAFQGIPGIFVYILYPRQEVSPKQEAQLTSINGNVRAVSVDGKFDDCQKMVKSAFLDPELRLFHLTSGNSINIGRLLPQMVYYFYAYSRLAKYEEKVIFSIPSGNFGNAIGCEIAYRMGLPVEKIIIATNENDEFPGFLQNGRYEKISPSRRCLSNSMNVGHPSNLGRLFDLYGGNVDKDGYVHRNPDRTAMRRHIFGVGISDSETIDTMVRIWREKKVILEPHGAVAFAGLESFREQEGEPDLPQIVLETAHPGKFSEVLQEYMGVTPEMPESLKHLQLKNRYIVLPNEYRIFKEYLFENLKR